MGIYLPLECMSRKNGIIKLGGYLMLMKYIRQFRLAKKDTRLLKKFIDIEKQLKTKGELNNIIPYQQVTNEKGEESSKDFLIEEESQ